MCPSFTPQLTHTRDALRSKKSIKHKNKFFKSLRKNSTAKNKMMYKDFRNKTTPCEESLRNNNIKSKLLRKITSCETLWLSSTKSWIINKNYKLCDKSTSDFIVYMPPANTRSLFSTPASEKVKRIIATVVGSYVKSHKVRSLAHSYSCFILMTRHWYLTCSCPFCLQMTQISFLMGLIWMTLKMKKNQRRTGAYINIWVKVNKLLLNIEKNHALRP